MIGYYRIITSQKKPLEILDANKVHSSRDSVSLHVELLVGLQEHEASIRRTFSATCIYSVPLTSCPPEGAWLGTTQSETLPEPIVVEYFWAQCIYSWTTGACMNILLGAECEYINEKATWKLDNHRLEVIPRTTGPVFSKRLTQILGTSLVDTMEPASCHAAKHAVIAVQQLC